ncbi:MAG: hydrogenase expression/formation protein HypE [Candidatus Thorarchaeota archaeon]
MDKYIEISHGAGGLKMDQLLHAIQSIFSNRNSTNGIGMDAFDDGAIIDFQNNDLIMTTDGHSVDPLFFPGGDIGKLSICGTVNDLIMMGAEPIALSCGLFLEEGLEFAVLEKVLQSMNEICVQNNIPIIAGDTKVIPKGKLDKILITTTGFGKRISKSRILDSNVQLDDDIIVTGPIGAHGIALLAFREGLSFKTNLISDVAALKELLLPATKTLPIHAMKDPTRGGLAAAINEWADKSNVEITLDQEEIPIQTEVQSAADMLGLDPLEISCEGKAIIAINSNYSNELLQLLRNLPQGSNAAIIGKVTKKDSSKVYLKTSVGGIRRLQKPLGELIPRVC